MEPYDPVPVMVPYDGEILVPLPVRGLIDAYVHESVKPQKNMNVEIRYFVVYTLFLWFLYGGEGVFRVKENSVFFIKNHDNNFGYSLYYAFIGKLSIC